MELKTTPTREEDVLSTYEPKTPLGRLILEAREKMKASGEPFLNEEELLKEIAERRGLRDED
ncbi:MAG: hypothetical protein KY468_11915 [Armatimonadetes bacterium]|nr:hypothetical protein [Armatimonadota bacterium]